MLKCRPQLKHIPAARLPLDRHNHIEDVVVKWRIGGTCRMDLVAVVLPCEQIFKLRLTGLWSIDDLLFAYELQLIELGLVAVFGIGRLRLKLHDARLSGCSRSFRCVFVGLGFDHLRTYGSLLTDWVVEHDDSEISG